MAPSFRFLQTASKSLAIGGAGLLGLGALTAHRFLEAKREQSDLLPGHVLWSFDQSKSPNDDGKKKKKVIVVGGGVVGVTAAYKLASRGHSVVLLEPRNAPGKECSACAAGGMQRSNPVVDRGTWIAVTKSFLPSTLTTATGDKPYRFFHVDWLSAITDPHFLRWSTTFARTSLFPRSEQRSLQREMLAFTDYAVRDMVDMMEDEADPMAERSGYNPSGSLSLSYDRLPATKEEEEEEDSLLKKKDTEAVNNGNPTRGKNLEPSVRLDGEDVLSREPSVVHQERRPTSAKFEYESRAASSERFTEELARRCVEDPRLDVAFLYGTRVTGADVGRSSASPSGDKKERVTRLRTNRGVIDVPEDAEVLVAAGAWTPRVMALLDLYAPVYPLKGYAMSLSAGDVLSSDRGMRPGDLPSRIVCDEYMYTSRLGDEIRITSVGEFSGWSTLPTPQVEKEFRREAVRQFPQLGSFIGGAKVRCGHRPYVSDGILLLGRVDSFDNLLVSCGPGSNGWKLAMGSGEIVERLVSGRTEEEISDELGFDARSFSPAGRVVRSPLFARVCMARWGVVDHGDDREDAAGEERKDVVREDSS